MTRDDQITRWFLAAVTLAAAIYAGFELTPSSYGVFLNMVGAPEEGPIAGVSRPYRADEWSVDTPLLQAAVRNRFQRINETSFYREDLRGFVALPLKDWSMAFKPQLWAFFVLSPARAFSIYYAVFLWLFLCGYHLLFRELNSPAWVAIAGAGILFFSGFTQFWWTTVGSLLAGMPWVLLILLKPMAWWKKALLCAWAFPAWIFSYAYPIPLMTLAWGALVIVLAFRPSSLRSTGNLVAIAMGVASTALVFYFYYGDLIRTIGNTVYPGHRIAAAGTTPIIAVLSELFPYLSFRLGDYQNLSGENICEIGALGSFLPLLTLCLLRYRSLRDRADARYCLLVLLAGFVVITLWEIAPVPDWIGRILLWNRGTSQRWLFTSGLLLTLAAMVIWSNRLISMHPLRIFLFVLLGPVASLVLKFGWLMHKGEADEAVFSESLHDMLLCGIAVAAGLAAWYVPAGWRAALLLSTVVFMNIYAFGGFNPLQPAGPIFQVPETDFLRSVRATAAASPGGVLAVADTEPVGAAFNGLGFRSVSHALLAPQLGLFRTYFPTMEAARFNEIFNRVAHIHLTFSPMPEVPRADVIDVPLEAFLSVRNARGLSFGPIERDSCLPAPAGGVDRVGLEGDSVRIQGWGPWTGETESQGIQVLSARSITGTLTTTRRPDIAELFQDYKFVRSGFELRVFSTDGKPIRAEELVLRVLGTSSGENRLACCGCP